MLVGHLKSKATQALTKQDIHPLRGHIGKRGTTPTPWSESDWTVFIDSADQLDRAIDYVGRHPMKEGLPLQHWTFVETLV